MRHIYLCKFLFVFMATELPKMGKYSKFIASKLKRRGAMSKLNKNFLCIRFYVFYKTVVFIVVAFVLRLLAQLGVSTDRQ